MSVNPSPCYAHTLQGQPPENWETLPAHAAAVADLASTFADAFGAAEWGRLLGLWHDLGKRSVEFQTYLRNTADVDAAERGHGPDHSTCGARHAAKTIGKHFGQLLAFCIAGHHGRLADGTSDGSSEGSTLADRLDPHRTVPAVLITESDRQHVPLKLPFVPERATAAFSVAFLTRMLFSALVDADRTATEAFCNPPQAKERAAAKPTVCDLHEVLDAFLQWKGAAAPPTPVNQMRAVVLSDCVRAAPLPPGFFSLTVPTGGGKTYASLAFALHHAAAHDLRRVVVAIPFTSIIEQTADAYRDALGHHVRLGLVEHHSNLDPQKRTRSNALAAENWDAPLIVTTNVQLYESLFAAATTPCRKLHRLARSVIVLDEAQTVPVELLKPTLMALTELVKNYDCTVVLCTATQPALEHREKDFPIGIRNPIRIIRDESTLFKTLKRVSVTRLGILVDDDLANRLAAERAVLCIVNTRAHAAKVYDALVQRKGRKGCYHLSTMMCAQHRREKLAEVRSRLKAGNACRLVSTQLIEAGVDVDFPIVFRGPAGFDAIAQAAGRCNREGLLDGGHVYVFDTETPPPPGLQRSAAEKASELADQFPNPIAPSAIAAYFRLFYWDQGNAHGWDKPRVLDALDDQFDKPQLRLKFRTAAQRYKLIDTQQHAIVVPYDANAAALCDRLSLSPEVNYLDLREAQRYTVGVPEYLLKKFAADAVIEPTETGLWVLKNDAAYSDDKGLTPGVVGYEPDTLIS